MVLSINLSIFILSLQAALLFRCREKQFHTRQPFFLIKITIPYRLGV